MKQRRSVAALLLSAALASASAFCGDAQDRRATAERFVRGLYGCNTSVVRELASRAIVVTYPGFREILGTPALRGADAVEAFGKHFCARWAEPELVIHESLSDGPGVVFVWSFSARDTTSAPDAPRSHWGGISFFRFDADGRIAAEIGEESTPGPMARFEAAAAR